MLVVVGIVALLLAVTVPLVAKARSAARSAACISNLRQVFTGFVQYANDNGHRLPDPYVNGVSWEQSLRPYLTDPNAFACGSDAEMFPAVGSSYDWRDTPHADTTMAGRVLTDTSRGEAVLAFEALPGWHAKGMMNAALLNGSAATMDQEHCLADLQKPIRRPGSAAVRPKPGGE